jgi:hypothetical protein
MVIKPEALEEFRSLHLMYFGTEISSEDAETMAQKLIRLVALIQPKKNRQQLTNVGKAV